MNEFQRIPIELQQSPHWIVWRLEPRGGKPTKVPYQVNGKLAKSNAPATWSPFHTAVQTYLNGGYDGIGYMFSQEAPYIGIDIDKCMEDGELTDLAREIVDLVASYTELSPSGKGVHIVVRGELPAGVGGTGRKNAQIGLELYRYGRFFTFTGQCLWYSKVEERTAEVAELFRRFLDMAKEKRPRPTERQNSSGQSNAELWSRMFASKSGALIRSMYSGELINDDHSTTDLALCNHLAFWTSKDPDRMDEMFRETDLYREKWDKQHASDGRTYGQMTIEKAIASTASTIDRNGSATESRAAPAKPKNSSTGKEKRHFRLSELGNAERMFYYHGERLRYANEMQSWLIWNGKHWAVDERLEVESIAAETLRALYKESRESKDMTLAKKLYEWAERCEKRSVRVNSILDMRPMAAVSKAELDSHKYLFNCTNGVIDLRTGRRLPHTKELLITKISNVTYEERAECPNWIAFLESIFVNDQGEVNHEIITFLQKAVGYALTGDISEQVVFFLYGTGRNGKSTFINTIQTLMGEYGRQTNSDTFIKKRNDNTINNDIARLDGARFVSAVESEEGQQLSESLVKQITGGEKMTARFMRQEFFEFTPEFKVFFTTNHKPIIKGNDEGIWRRIRLIPFEVTIPKEKVDKKLPEKLSKEMPGILRWAVEGCMLWQQEGLEEPEKIRLATEDYRQDMDILGPFMQERCVVHGSVKVEAKKLFDEYRDWCYKNGEIELKNRTFYRALEGRGYKKNNGAGNKVYFNGIGLKRENLALVRELEVKERVNENQAVNQDKVVPITRQKI